MSIFVIYNMETLEVHSILLDEEECKAYVRLLSQEYWWKEINITLILAEKG